MTERPRFDCAPGLRLQAHERLSEVHHRNIEKRLDAIEASMQRLEKRLWLAVYGVVAVVLTQGVNGLLTIAQGVAP